MNGTRLVPTTRRLPAPSLPLVLVARRGEQLSADERAQGARLRKIVALIAAGMAAAEALAFAGKVPHPLVLLVRGGGSLFLLFALFGSFVMQLCLCWSRVELYATLLVGVAFAALATCAGAPAEVGPESLGRSLYAAGLVVAAGTAMRARDANRERALQLLMACALPPGFVLTSDLALRLTIPLHPQVYDGLVRGFDVTLGIEPGLRLSRLIAAVPPIGNIAAFVYAATPLGFAILYCLQRRSRAVVPIDALSVFALVSIAGFTLYHALPVVGPCFVFEDWGPALKTLPALPLSPLTAVDEPRNCVPSLHTAWALLIFWHTRQQPRAVRIAAALFSGFTLLATLGFGLHYIADLVVAVPFTLAAQALAAPRSPARRRALFVGIGLVGLWFLALRSGALLAHPSAVVSWTLLLLTVGAGLHLERRLWRASVAIREASAGQERAQEGAPQAARRGDNSSLSSKSLSTTGMLPESDSSW